MSTKTNDQAVSTYRQVPEETSGLPHGIPYIIGNETAERFSFYGMRSILVVFMTTYLLGRDGTRATMNNAEATEYFHYFVSAVYFFPIVGALLSDGVLGKYKTILILSLVYCLGHLALAVDETRMGILIGLILIAIGSGGIKPCVSAHVGDQFGDKNQHLMAKVFSWFYFSINLGAFVSTLLTPVLLNKYGPHVAFGVPGVLMAIATLFFWLGRNKFIHVPPAGTAFVKEAFSGEGLKTIFRLVGIYAFVAVFWSLFDQTGSAWVLQAEKMDHVFLGLTILPSQLQAANPILILLLIPIFTYVVYPAIDNVFQLTPLRKISIGLFITSASFGASALIEHQLLSGNQLGIMWQVLPYIILTAGEVMVSITCLEFSYTQSPKSMKSVVMAIFYLSVTAGNLFTSFVNKFIQNADGTTSLEGAAYYWFFAAMMLGAAVLFVPVAMKFPVKES